MWTVSSDNQSLKLQGAQLSENRCSRLPPGLTSTLAFKLLLPQPDRQVPSHAGPQSAPGARCICGGCCAVCMKTTSAHVSVSGQPLQTSITSPSTGSVLWHPSVVLPVPQRRTLSGCNTLAFTSTVDPRIPLPRKLRHHGECSSPTSAATRCGVRLRVCTERLHSY